MNHLLIKSTVLLGVLSFWGCLETGTNPNEEEKVTTTECTAADCEVIDRVDPNSSSSETTDVDGDCTPIFYVNENGSIGEQIAFDDGIEYCLETIWAEGCAGNFCKETYGSVWAEEGYFNMIDNGPYGERPPECYVYNNEKGEVYDVCQ